MKIAIHQKELDFSSKWIEYCKNNHIEYKIVNCYSNNIIDELEDCDALMWHFSQANSRDILFAKQLVFSLETAGKIVFPNFYTAWHFDDKVGQKYLLEAIDASLVPSYVFYDKQDAMSWIGRTDFPKVFKLRGGAGSANVRIVKSKTDARKLVSKAFGRGFSQYDKWGSLKERWYKYRKGKSGLWNVMKGLLRFGRTTELARVAGRERGYIYFQDFISGCKYDYRLKVVNGKCWGFKRFVRENDFRASGSDNLHFNNKDIPVLLIKSALEISKKLKLQSVAFDYLEINDRFLLIEMSYCFGMDDDELNYGFWNKNLVHNQIMFNPFGWMVEGVVKEIESRS